MRVSARQLRRQVSTAYRTLVIRRKIEEIPPEKLTRFIDLQQKFREWATGSGFKAAAPTENPLKYFAKELKMALRVVPTNGLKNGVWKVPLPFDTQLRLNNEKDASRGVFVDLPRREVRIRKWGGGGTITIPLRESEVRWIQERTREGGRLVLAYVWVGLRGSNITTFNLALVFAREVALMEPRRLLVVDLNALHNGIVIATVERGRVLQRGVLRPDVGEIGRLQNSISRLDSLCAERGVRCKEAVAAKSRLWRLLRRFEDEVAKKLVKLAVQYKAVIVVDAPKDDSLRQLKESSYAPEKKIFLNVGRLRRRIRQLAGWYGVTYREERLYSTICPRCGAKMEEMQRRRVKCIKCGFEAPRDEVPILWAAKRFQELIQPPSFSHRFIPLSTPLPH